MQRAPRWSARVATLMFMSALAATSVADTRPTAPRPPAASPRTAARVPGNALGLSAGVTLLGAGVLLVGVADPWTTYRETGDGRCCPRTSTAAYALIAIGGAAVLVGPTTGHVYAGRTWNRGLKVRVAAVAVGALGAVVLTGAQPGQIFCQGGACTLGALLVVGAGVTLVVGTFSEIAAAPAAVRRHNQGLAASTFGVTAIRARDRLVPGVAYGRAF